MPSSATTVVSAEGAILDQILDATFTIWHEGLTRDAYGRWWAAQLRTPWGRKNLTRRALVRGGDVVASAKEYHLTALVDSRSIDVLGIGAVFTQPAHRGRGFARELIDRILDDAARRGTGAALLFSEIGAEYYERLEFRTIPTTERWLRVAEPARRGAPAMLVRAGDDRDLPAIAAIGRVRAEPYRFHLARDPDLIQFAMARKRLLAGLGRPGARELQFFVAEEGAAAVAYVAISSAGGEWTLEEAGDRDPSCARVGAILQTLLARQPAERRPAIRARLPAAMQPPQVSIVEARAASEVMMIRALASAVPELREEDVLYWHADVF